LIILCIIFQAAHDSSCFFARASAFLPFANQTISISLPAKNTALFSRSVGLFECCCNTLRTSLTCKTAQTPLPITSFAFVICTDIFIHSFLPTRSNLLCQSLASLNDVTFAVGQTGISINECVTPIAYFLAIIELTTFALDCIERGYCTLINLSSAGARSSHPPQTKQQLTFFTNSSIPSLLKLISIRTFTHSPVAAGDVIDFEKFFGIFIPKLAISGISAIVVSLPGTHPI
jgi:hypothetical protein